ncbi:hypothetical protein E2C01_023338 [Portunus trituberculatus]|uniref:Uncharacterized protein n=1 Tax=Portunus trituberculatus TaxID=210409 RepID=A0A5B7EAW1_PORTR|nr:hypothetical protein [Portunus trituberculatus]
MVEEEEEEVEGEKDDDHEEEVEPEANHCCVFTSCDLNEGADWFQSLCSPPPSPLAPPPLPLSLAHVLIIQFLISCAVQQRAVMHDLQCAGTKAQNTVGASRVQMDCHIVHLVGLHTHLPQACHIADLDLAAAGDVIASEPVDSQETVAQSEEAQPTLGPWTGFEPVRLETPRTPKHAWFHCTTVDPTVVMTQQFMQKYINSERFKGNVDSSGYSYGSLNAARSANFTVAQINGTPVGQHKILHVNLNSVLCFVNGCFSGNVLPDITFSPPTLDEI